ncbi:TetR/AcrR family transcriptional regulator [Amycolatopsis sp. WGS_07]|uniref:TetR/AcrR family transcriptional regulator n=1 Tax=Amycolatopsis sp. WGS_07 TaxID=3076764 RepID=UPI0038737E63
MGGEMVPERPRTGRMSRSERRTQLMRTAFEIVRFEGANALTLVRLAERAGVSRPVVYDHFSSREGLLMALYRDYDEQIVRTIRQVSPGQARSLDEVVSVLAAAYVEGVLAAGRECGEVQAALLGSPETGQFLRQSRRFYVEEFRTALEPFVSLSADADLALLTAILGIVESLARAAAEEEFSAAHAVATATSAVVGVLRGNSRQTIPT